MHQLKRNMPLHVRSLPTIPAALASLIETRRVGGKVHHEHIAGLGSIDAPPSVRSRLLFWSKLPARLARLSNRVAPAEQVKICAAIHARIPMVTADEARARQIEVCEADERFWNSIGDHFADMAESHDNMAEGSKLRSAQAQAAAGDAKSHARAAQARLTRLKAGETVEGGLLDQPMTQEDMLKIVGWTTADLHHAWQLGLIDQAGLTGEFIAKISSHQERAEKRLAREFARRARCRP
jgi:hypothetical protein